MGKISERIIELTPKIAKMYEMMQRCNTRILRNEMFIYIFNSFLLYRPLSYNEHRLYVTDNMIVTIHEWIKLKRSWRSRGSYLDSYSDFYELICKYGDEMSQYVRRSIKDEFIRLVQLTKQLQPYNELAYTKDVDKVIHILHDYDVTDVKSERIIAIRIETDHPDSVKLVYGHAEWERHTFNLLSLKSIHVIEDVIDDLMPLYEMAVKDVSAIKEHNDKILEEIKKLVMPRYISNELEERS